MTKHKLKSGVAQQQQQSKQVKKVSIALDEDKEIPSQKFACISFLSPENILKKKEIFYFERFLKHWELSKTLDKTREFLKFISYKYNLDFNLIHSDLEEFVEAERETIQKSNIDDDFAIFVEKYGDELQDKFDEAHEFQTSVRGLKIRGCFSTKQEADTHCKELRMTDQNHSIFVGDVGKWLPWDPLPSKTGEVTYQEEELNKLMNEKNKNDKKSKEFFNERVKDAKKKAIAENEQKAETSKVVLTQTIDEDGNLIGRQNNASTIEKTFAGRDEDVSIDEIKSVLFEGDNIVIPKSEMEKEGKKIPQSLMDTLKR